MGKGATSQDASLEAAETSNATALTQIAQQQQGNAQTLFNESNPGFAQAEQFYGTLSSGDPYAIAQAIAPATQQISQATAGAKANIMNAAPAGGEKNLALENADVKQGAEVGKVASQGYLGSFNALAKLASQGTGESTAMTGQAMQGYGAASQIQSGIVQQNMQQKGQTLGAYNSLLQDSMTGGKQNPGMAGQSPSSAGGGGGGFASLGSGGDASAGFAADSGNFGMAGSAAGEAGEAGAFF